MTRLLTAAFLIPGAWYLCKRAPFSLFLTAALLLTGLAAWECAKILSHRGSRPFVWLTVAVCLGVVGAFALQPPFVAVVAVMTTAALLSPALAMLCRKTPESMLDATIATLFPVDRKSVV